MKPTIEHILVPTDLTRRADAAIAYGTSLATALGARLHLVHVLEEPFTTAGPYEFALPDTPERRERRYQRAHESLADKAALAPNMLAVTTEVRNGVADEEILKAAIDYGADLIVMTTHARSGIDHIVKGSFTERVLRRAKCPVLAVQQPERPLDWVSRVA
jgi:nucleotide-binding universal stress UspA family protein